MTASLLNALQRQALLLTLGVLLLLALRPLLLERLGARATYAAWLLLPALLVTPLLPSLAAQPLPVLVTVAELARTTTAPLLVAPHTEALWPSLLLAAWLGGAALVLALQAARQWRLARHGARLPAGASPALVGLWQPRVALPADFEARFAPEERELILAHEHVHRARGDNAWNLLACGLTALHWWNPLAWLAARRMQADQELACDAVVLQQRPDAIPTYTRALLAAHGLTPHGAPLASRWGSSHPLVERIEMLNQPNLLSRRRAVAVGLSLLTVVGFAYAAQGGTPDAAAARKVEIRMTIASDGRTSTPRLITALGVLTTIEWGATPGDVWRLEMTITQDADGKLQVVTDSSHNRERIGHHVSHIASGDKQGLKVGVDGGQSLDVERIVTLLPADFQLPR